MKDYCTGIVLYFEVPCEQQQQVVVVEMRGYLGLLTPSNPQGNEPSPSSVRAGLPCGLQLDFEFVVRALSKIALKSEDP